MNLAFLQPAFLRGYFLLLVTAFLSAVGSSRFCQGAGREKENKSPNIAQIPAAGFEVQQPSQNFWAQTNGPKGAMVLR